IGVARAEPAGAMPFRVHYDAPQACPDVSEFERQILARTTLAREAGAAEEAHVFSVTIRSEAGESRGQLKIDEPEGATSTRSFADARCEEVVGSLALIAALTLDPDASTKPLASPAKPSATPNPESKKNPPTTGVQPKQAPPASSSGVRMRSIPGWQASSGV